MTTSDLIGEFARNQLPRIVRDIARQEVRALLKKIDNERAAWECTWCSYKNVRFNAGMDHCSICGAETFTYFVAAGDLRVRYSRNPDKNKKIRKAGKQESRKRNKSSISGTKGSSFPDSSSSPSNAHRY